MADTRKNVECSYCGAGFSIKYNGDDMAAPEFCAFCGEFGDTDGTDDDDDDSNNMEPENEESGPY